MTTTPAELSAAAPQLATRDAKRRWRQFKDRAARVTVFAGGISVIGALVLIFVYLFYVVLPLFAPAGADNTASYNLPIDGDPVFLSVEEQAEIGLALDRNGDARFFAVADGSAMKSVPLALPAAGITAVSEMDREKGVVAVAAGDNDVTVFKHEYRISFDGDDRTIVPSIGYPLGESALALRDRPVPVQAPVPSVAESSVGDLSGTTSAAVPAEPVTPVPLSPIRLLAVRNNEGVVRLAAHTEDGELWVRTWQESSGLFAAAGSGELTAGQANLVTTDREIQKLIMTPEGDILYAAYPNGAVRVYELDDTEVTLRETFQAVPRGVSLQQIELLSGGDSLIAVGSDNRVRQSFPVRDDNNRLHLIEIRQFDLPKGSNPISIERETRRRGFLIGDASGRLDVYYSTSERRVLSENMVSTGITQMAIAPRANTVLAIGTDDKVNVLKLHNEHPEVSWSALWGKVWYEGYGEPDYVWQSSAASNDFEAKFSLTPLAFGTLKAAFYAMVIAVPLAIMGAIFTANFMSPRMRTMVKPTIEVMEALPTVILGFLAGLWLAPIAENNLPAALMLVPALVFGLIFTAWTWSRLPGRIRYLVPEGWEAALLVPAVAAIGAFVFLISAPVENAFFGGDMPAWFDQELGIGYDQRNALVVGFAMGFAVIPTIFSISEDAIFSVPKHLSQGSLALGATPWQTLVRVVLPTASPGIFSGVMIGMGRAVGETMIVLMATGNTAIMDWSIFEGMRTLSANIAVEMPESEVASTHYRILFLAGLVLFVFTFIFNTLAETVRQRLRAKYSSI